MVGIQAQNIYLLNYVNKLEFLLQETVKERKEDKLKKKRQLKSICKALSGKEGISAKALEYCKSFILCDYHQIWG